MSQATGAKSRVLGWPETSYGVTPGTPVARLLYVQQFGLKGEQARDTDPTISGYRGMVRGVLGRRTVSGSALVTLAPQSIGFWLKHLIGTPATTGAGPYEHTFAVAASGAGALPPGAGFEVDYSTAIGTPGRFQVYAGCRINSGVFTFPTTGVPTLNLDIVGADFDSDNVATLDASPTDDGHAAWGVGQIALEWDDGAQSVCMESLTLTVNNDLDDGQFCVGNGAVRHALPEGFAPWSLAGSLFFDTASMLNAALADDDVKVVITLSKGDGLGSAGNESLVITIPLMTVTPSSPPIDGPKGLKMAFAATAHRTSGELGVTAVLSNALATI